MKLLLCQIGIACGGVVLWTHEHGGRLLRNNFPNISHILINEIKNTFNDYKYNWYFTRDKL